MVPEEKNTLTPQTGYGMEKMEINLSGRRVNLVGFLMGIVFMILALLTFDFIWGYESVSGSTWTVFIGVLLCYILLQFILAMIFTRGNIRAVRFTIDRKGCGFLIREPIALKYYRVILLVPVILLGLIPAFHGFCSGNRLCYVFGIFMLIASCGDCMFFWKLRHFDDEDKIKDGGETFNATIIKGDKAN